MTGGSSLSRANRGEQHPGAKAVEAGAGADAPAGEQACAVVARGGRDRQPPAAETARSRDREDARASGADDEGNHGAWAWQNRRRKRVLGLAQESLGEERGPGASITIYRPVGQGRGFDRPVPHRLMPSAPAVFPWDGMGVRGSHTGHLSPIPLVGGGCRTWPPRSKDALQLHAKAAEPVRTLTARRDRKEQATLDALCFVCRRPVLCLCELCLHCLIQISMTDRRIVHACIVWPGLRARPARCMHASCNAGTNTHC
jgi:hypothetical protein